MFEKIPDIMTFKECQKLLKVGKNTLLDLIHSHRRPYRPFLHRRRILCLI
jgi:hypothetical protein